ncbi:MAG: hypothetical protein AB7Y46_01480 [Armatimonadota bacterium]
MLCESAQQVAIALAVTLVCATAGAAQYEFERIGVPCIIRSLPIQVVAPDGKGGWMAWGDFESPDQHAIIGVNVATGATTWVDVGQFGFTHIALTLGRDGRIYVYTGNPAHFLAYDMQTGELEDLGVPASPANYFGRGQMGPDGKYYIGSYPGTHLVCVDTATGEIAHLAKIAEDPREKYLWPNLAVADDGIVYCPIGLHHKELWSFDPATGAKHQILPADLTAQHGQPTIWLAEDGQVYGRAGSAQFLCQPDRIVTDVEILPASDRRAEPRMAGDYRVQGVDKQGRLVLTKAETGETSYVQTDYEGQPQMIYCVGCEREGKIWGGALFPSNTWTYDPATGELEDLGVMVGGGSQIYDILSTPQGLLMASYGGACMDLYDPTHPGGEGNPHRFERVPMQERPVQWAPGPDGRIYIGTVPVKGILGGALVRLDLSDLSIAHWRNIVANQSIMYCAAVPETNELICASSIQGGSSAIPSETEAFIVLWDCDAERVVHRDRPVPGTTSYGRLVRAQTGIVYGLAGAKYFAYDPVKRETVFVGDMPGTSVHFPGLNDEPVGPRGLIYGLVGNAVVAIDPADHSVSVIAEHESIGRAHGFLVTQAGVLYYGSSSELWRCDLSGN